jgi:hypothetical protein
VLPGTARSAAAVDPAPELTGVVTVLIDGPIAVDDQASTDPSEPVVVPVAANDSGIGEDCLAVATGPQHGTAEPDQESGDITYTPDPGFAGTDEFDYQFRDSCGDSESSVTEASVTITVRHPVARADTARTFPGRAIVIDVLANDGHGQSFAVPARGPPSTAT